MKFAISISLFLISTGCFANKIDNLQSPEDVLKFIKKTLHKEEEFTERTAGSPFRNFKFIKLDVNNDGLTDILINGHYLYAVVDKGGKKGFAENRIDGHSSFNVLSIDTAKAYPLLIVQKSTYDSKEHKIMYGSTDTLINLYGGFIEYNPSPKKIELSRIKIMTTACYGTCPVFDLTIDSSRHALLNAKQYNKLKGIYKSKLDEKLFNKLSALLNYLNIESLQANYAIDWSDNPAIGTEIDYNGSKKKIHDYGMEGTLGLERLYELLYEIKDTQHWR